MIERTPEYRIREIMGEEYIDTPGFYNKERRYYKSIFEFMIQNMGKNDFNKLKSWYKNNSIKVRKLAGKK